MLFFQYLAASFKVCVETGHPFPEVVQGTFEEVVRHKEIFFHIFLFDAVSGFTRQNHQLADNVFSAQVDARVGFGVTFLLRHFDSTAERNVGTNLIEDII